MLLLGEKNIRKPLECLFLLQIIKIYIFNYTNTSTHFSLCSFCVFLPSPYRYTDLRVLETSFLLLINCFLLNLTQQLKFFRRRFEIVVPCATCRFHFFSRVPLKFSVREKKSFGYGRKLFKQLQN